VDAVLDLASVHIEPRRNVASAVEQPQAVRPVQFSRDDCLDGPHRILDLADPFRTFKDVTDREEIRDSGSCG
jgi:hypothetical protein